jgi:spore coat protein C
MLKAKITTGVTSIMLLSAVFTTPALADTDVRIAGNGSHSDNDVSVNLDRTTTVRQNNDTNISNNVSVSNNTGHNSVSGNTGGDVNVRTGDATANVNISNQAGSNVANIDGCCDGGGARIKIEGNGTRSDNSVDFSKSSDLTLIQNNDTDIDNDVDIHNNTGHNSVDGNTWGDVDLQTGDAEANVSIRNEAGKNVANIDGCCDGGDTNISIVGNGSRSDNTVRYDNDSDRNIYQNNDTDFDNDVNVHNNTGYNDAEGSNKYHKFFKKDYDRKDYDHDKVYDHDKKYYDHDKKDRDYDHDKISYDRYKNYFDHDSYKKDYDKDRYDHDKKYYPDFKKVVYLSCDYDHWMNYSWKYWEWYKDNCDHGKKYYHPVIYFDYDRDYHDNDNHKKYDRDDKKYDFDHYKKVTYKKDDYDHDKKYDHGKRHDGNKYVLTKYPKYSYDNDRDYCKYDTNRKHSYNPWSKYTPYHGGNTGGDVTIRTGDATANVNLHNAASSNYLNIH